MPRQFDRWALDFPRRWEERRSSKGEPFRVFAAYGMPRLHERFTSVAFYLFCNRSSAEKGKDMQGTGFFLGVDSTEVPNLINMYAVSNVHVVHDLGASVIRINKKDGTHHILEFGPEDWDAHPDGDDLAILPLDLTFPDIDAGYMNESMLVAKEEVAGGNSWGVGDDVFMIGLFTGYSGKVRNEPSVRSGIISLIPKEKIAQPGRKRKIEQESICLDMRSVGGYSGSPVLVYRALAFQIIGTDDPKKPSAPLQLLGVHWGSIPDISEAEIIGKTRNSMAKLKGHAGITCLVPGWILRDMLMSKKYKDQRITDEKKWARDHAPKPAGTLETANPNHRKDFDRLLDKAVKRKK